MYLEVPGYAGVKECIIWLFELTAPQGLHTLLSLCPGMDPLLLDRIHIIESFVVSP